MDSLLILALILVLLFVVYAAGWKHWGWQKIAEFFRRGHSHKQEARHLQEQLAAARAALEAKVLADARAIGILEARIRTLEAEKEALLIRCARLLAKPGRETAHELHIHQTAAARLCEQVPFFAHHWHQCLRSVRHELDFPQRTHPAPPSLTNRLVWFLRHPRREKVLLCDAAAGDS